MSAFGTCTVTHYHHPSSTDNGSFRAALDDVIIIPFVFVGLAASKILRFILSILMRLFDYAFTLAMQLVWLPLFAAKVLGDGIVAIINGVLHFLPLSETKLRQWSETDPPKVGRGSDGRLATGLSNMLCILPLKAAWHGCSENAVISLRTLHCS